ncbi:MAG TPA: hypothetical protein ENN19_19200 [Chloroflexi bacterium]|nr:hypothetical protein [Chloroflexota bacterium]
MNAVYMARVNCPNCQKQFQAPIEQVVDVRVDPNAKARLLNGLINVISCPHCNMGGALNLPFLYHDPENELALIYMSMEAGRDNVERQKAIGQLTQQAMDSLPPEERKGYLLQPQEFLSVENLIKKVLEVDGITPEMIEARQEQAQLLREMIEIAADEEALESLIRENEERVNEDLLQMVAANRRMLETIDEQGEAIKILDTLYDKLLALTAAGQKLSKRQDILDALQEKPNREKLLALLIQAPDEETREILMVIGLPLLDYQFFRALTDSIESASNDEERKRLEALRKEILDTRDQIQEQTKGFYEKRINFVQDLLASENPEWLARYRYQEIDQGFFEVLRGFLESAQEQGKPEFFERLKQIWNIVIKLVREQQPPTLVLLDLLLDAEGDEALDALLSENENLLSADLLEYAEAIEQNMREEDQINMANRMAFVAEKIRQRIEA